MEFIAETHSMYPRVGESNQELRLRRAYHDNDHGKIDEENLNSIMDSYVEEVIKEQESAGLDIITDGMIRWYDHISHLTANMAGAEVGGLIRYFDTNYLVREAQVTGPVEWQRPIVVDGYEFARDAAEKPVKVILTGPLTLARHSVFEDSSYINEEQLVGDYAAVLEQEIRALSEAGVKHLQIEEPALLQTPEDADWVMPLLEKLFEAAGDIEVRLATYFGDAAGLYDEFQACGADILLFDFTYSENLVSFIKEKGSAKRIAFGILDGRNTKLDDVEKTVNTIKSVAGELPDGKIPVTFSSSLDYLPRDRARQKLERLATVRDSLNEGAGL